MTYAEKESFHRSLPTKRIAAGCVFRNSEGEVLIVKPTYKDYWDLPGGVVEDGESLLGACRREVREEIGIDLLSASLLCVDYCSSQPGYIESIQVLFDGGVLGTETSAQVRPDGKELSEVRWVSFEAAASLLGERVGRRLTASVAQLGTGVAVYLEDQQRVSL